MEYLLHNLNCDNILWLSSIGASGLRALQRTKCPLLTAFFLCSVRHTISAGVVRGRAEGQACTDPGARTPIGVFGKYNINIKFGLINLKKL